ncbi:phosphate binding protein [Acholeplasma oculi]|uniref:Phosphate ABC transporter, periplasmic phosphate-binding protein PstS n=1 Tax=Acholeplasma oculi TaxID=35623 RepID=A0A061AGU6_9MOLU|nr:substrate-binding domain-containing protein [Acholeplasma oculi]CDR30172.1 Phosphate ABC transporter, periplasmic phosphate-binding protein PstS [Acholeplasma oculi]SKC44261.1 phosphate ABC transporter substrate-binding protein, PhoT family [Acholeplasma oculi]SUT88511.1 phosphate binding protein [Acholeplasma oculi]
MKRIVVVTLLLFTTLLLVACGPTQSGFNQGSNITVYTRDTTSGTRAGFMEGIGFKDATANDSLLVQGFVIQDNTQIFTSMQTDVYGIGYVSLSTLNSQVKGLDFEGVAPTVANVLNDTYGLKRPFMYMTRAEGDYPSETVEALVNAFVAYLGTTDASDIINNSGAIALPSTATWDDIKADHPITNQDNSSVTVRFGGSDSIQKVAEALTNAFKPKAGNFIAEHDHTGSGDAFKRTWDPAIKDTSVGKDVGFSSRYFTTSEIAGSNEDNIGQLAWDAIVAIVHKNNPVSNVTAQHLKNVYNGTFKTWNDLITAQA